MDSLPGTPQIQNIIPTTFFKTDVYAAPWLGIDRRGCSSSSAASPTSTGGARQAAAAGEGYGDGPHQRAASRCERRDLANPFIALLPLVAVGVMNKVFTVAMPRVPTAPPTTTIRLGGVGHRRPRSPALESPRSGRVEGALLVGILPSWCSACQRVAAGSPKAPRRRSPARCSPSMNTASEYGFGGGDRGAAGLHRHQRRAQGHPEPAGQRGDHASRRWRESPVRHRAA